MKIAYCSDLHLEFGGRDFEFPEADVIILAGDILLIDDIRDAWDFTIKGINARNFLREVSVAYKNVIFIPGNHEFYSGNIDTSCKKMTDYLMSEGIKNVTFGPKISVHIAGVSFICATLWTDLKRSDPLVMSASNMSDYDDIMVLDNDTRSGGRYLRPKDTVAIHNDHKRFIADSLLYASDRVVIVTHHAPNLLSSEEEKPTLSDYYYCCTDMDDLILDNPSIKYWVHGHLHTRKTYNVGDTVVISNCRGYFGHEHSAVKSFKIKVVEIL